MTPFDTFGASNQPILHFAHANGFPPNVYSQFLNPLAEHYTITAAHHRPLWDDVVPTGFGTTWRTVADDLISFLDHHNVRDAVGVGHSMGSVATMYVAAERPDIFSRLVLMDPVFLPPPVLEMIAPNPELGAQNPMVLAAQKRRFHWPNRQDAWERFRKKSVFARFPDKVLWDYVNAATHPVDGGVALTYSREWEAYFYSRPPLDVYERLAEIKTPTLAIRGVESNALSAQSWATWQAQQPHATFIEVQDAGHLVMLEYPEKIADIVLNWLS